MAALFVKIKKYFKKPSRFLFFRHIKYARTENDALCKWDNGIFDISKTRINTKPFPRISGAESAYDIFKTEEFAFSPRKRG